MKKLNKEQVVAREECALALHAALEKVEADYSILEDMIKDYNEGIDELNMRLDECRQFISDITGDMESYADEKSEKWQESDAGNDYQAWRDVWQELELEDMEHMEIPPSPTDSRLSTIPDELRELPSEPG